MTAPALPPRERITAALRALTSRLSPKQRQYALLGAILAGGVGFLWLILAVTAKPAHPNDPAKAAEPSGVTNIGVMPPGTQVNPVDQWVGTAGRKLAQYESERDEQNRLNKERSAFEQRAMQRFTELEQKLVAANQAASAAAASAAAAPQPQAPANAPSPAPTTALPAPTTTPTPRPSSSSGAAATGMPPASSLPGPTPGRDASSLGMPPGFPDAAPAPVVPRITRITVSSSSALAQPAMFSGAPKASQADSSKPAEARTVATFLPVSFTRGTLLGGLDAPTGGQAQANPHPVLIRLSDTSVLPNRMRGEYRECFVIAAGYGDISSERAYLRTESLSCVRPDGATLEVRIQGSVYGEDGKVGLRGRLVTKQGQMLANALLAGVVSGIGQGLATSSTEYSTSALGTVATTGGSEAYRAGLGSGVGKALDRLAQYYIKLAENTFPVIEVDAGREIDVVITKGVRIDTPMTATPSTAPTTATTAYRADASPANRYLETTDDSNY